MPNGIDEQSQIDGVRVQIEKTLRSMATDSKLPRF